LLKYARATGRLISLGDERIDQPWFIRRRLDDFKETSSASRVRHERVGGSQQDGRPMRLFKTSFFWQFAGGFALGAAGLFAMQPADVGIPGQPAATHVQR
jgi:hypothetical protein